MKPSGLFNDVILCLRSIYRLLKVAKAVIAVTTWQVVAFYVFLPPSSASCDKREGVIPDGNPPGKPPGESGGVESGPPSGPNIFEGPAAPSVDQPIDVSREDEPPPSQAPAEDTGEFCLPFDADEYAALFNDVFFQRRKTRAARAFCELERPSLGDLAHCSFRWHPAARAASPLRAAQSQGCRAY